jgi:D-lactate dehydrogenase (cytochrome)
MTEQKVTDVYFLATLKLAVVPEDQAVAVVCFPSIRNAAATAASVMQAGIPIAAMEILDDVQMRVINLSGSTAPRKWQEKPTLFFKFAGTQAGVNECVDRVRQLAGHQGGSDFEFAADEKEQKLLWSARKESLWSMLALRKEGEDVCKSAWLAERHRHRQWHLQLRRLRTKAHRLT